MPRRDLVAHHLDRFGGRPDPRHAGGGDGAGEVGILREEPVARMHALGAALADRVEDRVGVQIALGGSLPAERVRLVGVPHVGRVAIELGVDGDGRDAELATRAHHANSDLASVGDEDLREHGCVSYGETVRTQRSAARRKAAPGRAREPCDAARASELERSAPCRYSFSRRALVRRRRLDESLRARMRGGRGPRRHRGGRRRADGRARPARAHLGCAARCGAARISAPATAASPRARTPADPRRRAGCDRGIAGRRRAV